MSDLQLTKTKFAQGVWQGIITQPGTDEPQIEATFENARIEGITLSHNPEANHWLVSVPIPAEAIADGVHCIIIRDRTTDEGLGHIGLIAGDAIGDDIRAEVDLLRAELDMLKRAFRRHCLETSG